MRKRRKQMPPIEVEGVEYRCGNSHFWPPPEIEHLAESAEDLRYTVPDVVYQRIKTWEQVCGLLSMSAAKCPGCKMVVVDGTPTKKVGTGLGDKVLNKRVIRMKVNQKKRE